MLCCAGTNASGRLTQSNGRGRRQSRWLSAEKEAYRRRVLEHLTHMTASGQRSAAPIRTNPQFAIHLVGEVHRNGRSAEAVEPGFEEPIRVVERLWAPDRTTSLSSSLVMLRPRIAAPVTPLRLVRDAP